MQLALVDFSEGSAQTDEQQQQVAHADILLFPMSIFSQDNLLQNQIIQTAFSSAGKKVFIPQHMDGFEWVGVRIFDSNNLSKRTAKTVKKILAGETNISERPMGCLAIGGIVVGLIVIFILLIALAVYLTY